MPLATYQCLRCRRRPKIARWHSTTFAFHGRARAAKTRERTAAIRRSLTWKR
jgi:hypothetical protein